MVFQACLNYCLGLIKLPPNRRSLTPGATKAQNRGEMPKTTPPADPSSVKSPQNTRPGRRSASSTMSGAVPRDSWIKGKSLPSAGQVQPRLGTGRKRVVGLAPFPVPVAQIAQFLFHLEGGVAVRARPEGGPATRTSVGGTEVRSRKKASILSWTCCRDAEAWVFARKIVSSVWPE